MIILLFQEMLSIPKDFFELLTSEKLHWIYMEHWTTIPSHYTRYNKMRLNLIRNYDYKRIIFVRHPFTRLVSAYRDKVLGARRWTKEIFNATNSVRCQFSINTGFPLRNGTLTR